jgi:hypothetical protein
MLGPLVQGLQVTYSALKQTFTTRKPISQPLLAHWADLLVQLWAVLARLADLQIYLEAGSLLARLNWN